MPDLTIGQLPNASQVDPLSLFVAEQSSNAVNVTGAQLLEFANVETAAQVQSATKSAQAAAQSAQKAQNASSAIQNLGVSAETVPPTSTAEVLKTVDPTSGTVTLEFQIPAGTPGAAGPPGADGVSPYQVAQENGYTGTEADFNSRLAQIDEMCLEPLRLTTPAMGQTAENGPLELYEIRGNTVLGGTPAYDAPVSMASVEGPLILNISGKNLLDFSKFYKQTDTNSGITFLANEQKGSIALSGTCKNASGQHTISFSDTKKEQMTFLPAGTYTLSGNKPEYYSKGLKVFADIRDLNNEYINDYLDVGYGYTFELDSDSLMQLRFTISDGANMDGVSIYPQIETGGIRSNHMPHQGGMVEIPLTGTNGRELEPLRMVYTGSKSNKTPYADRILRKNGLWCIERNTMQLDFSNVTWSKFQNYMAPIKDGSMIEPGVRSDYTLCTHFPIRGSAGESSGIWTGIFIAIGNDVLPNGAATTAEEMKQFCAEQSASGTPVLVCTPISPPVYEELHQDVQVLLNTLSVPGGTCSVWLDGDFLPSADIGLPREDCADPWMEGAYRWLGELSNPLATPAQDDLFAWALDQQRGGVFATDGGATTKNVPEAGNLTGILSVTKQGQDVSMLVFGPTGKFHTANRIAGVWRGWSTLSEITLNQLGITAKASELNYVSGVTSPLQTQISNRLLKKFYFSEVGGSAYTFAFRNNDASAFGSIGGYGIGGIGAWLFMGFGDSPWLPENALIVSPTVLKYKNNDVYHAGNPPKLENMGVTAKADELNYVSGVTSSIQEQLNAITAQIGDIAAQLDAINGEVV